MLFSVSANAVYGLGYVIFGGVLASVLLAIVILIEAVVLRLLNWSGCWRSLGASLLMNLVSGLIGLLLIWVLMDRQVALGLVGWYVLLLSGSFAHLLEGARSAQGIVILCMVTTCMLSIAIEGSVLTTVNPSDGRRNWIAALVTNAVSYLLLYVATPALLRAVFSSQ
jgi:hypothetical protein